MSEHSSLSDMWVDKYEALIQEASKAYLSKKYSVALKNYAEALKIIENSRSGKKICILEYMIACCLVESDVWDDLAEAVKILMVAESTAKKRFPAIYGVMARAHYKLFRFKEALNAIIIGEEILSSTPKNLLQEFYIPGTNIAIEQDKEGELWKKIKAECTTFHEADAICFLKNCINITEPYTDANRNIFKKDPAFSGMVIVTCSNAKQPCTFVYHPTCWKAQKDLICPVKKVSDRDMLGHACFLENCSYNNTRSVITDIEIIGANGKTKTHIKPPGSESLQEYSKDGRIELLGNRQESILVLNDEFDIEVDFSDDDPVIAQNKKFWLEVFESYISQNIVTVSDVYAKYEEYSELLQLGANLDILSFLLSTGRFKIMDDKTRMPNFLSQNDHVYGEITVDSYSAIMSDNDKSSVGKSNKECELKNFLESNTCEKAGGGDAPAQKTQKVSDKPTPSATVSSSKTVQQTSEHERKVTENKTLKDFISQLEADMDQLTTENENLKTELINKNSELEALQKQMNENNKKWKTIQEQLSSFTDNYESMKKENITLRTKIIDLLQAKEELQETLSEVSSPEVRHKEILESFQGEYKILEEKINLEWAVKSEKLKEALQQELETRMTLLGKCLNNQYSSNKNLINGYIDRCNHTLEVINKINAWMTTTAEIRQFLDSSEWEVTKTTFAKALSTVQEEYQALNNKLLNDKSTEKYEMRDISLTNPNMPVIPGESISDFVLKALNAFHDQQRAIIQNLQQELSTNQAKLLAYSKIIPPSSLRAPPSRLVTQKEMQQQMQDLQQEVQMMRRKLEQNIQDSCAGSDTSSNESLTSAGKGSSLKMTPVVTKPAKENEQRDTARLNDRDQSTVNASGERIVYDTGSCTGSIRDNASTASKDTYKLSEPVKKPDDEHQQHWTPCKNHVETYGNWQSEEARPAPLQRPAKPYRHSERNETRPPSLMRPSDNRPAQQNDEARYQDDCDNLNRPYSELFDHSKPAQNVVKITAKQEKEFNENLVIKYLLEDSTEEKYAKRPNLDAFVNRLKAKYPGTSEADIISIISEIRKRHHNSLTGLTLRQIVEESEEFFTNNHHIHVIRYFPTGVFEIPTKASDLQHVDSDSESIDSFYTATRGPESISSFVNSPKKSCRLVSPVQQCTICMVEIYKTDLYPLYCGHSFHKKCAKSWFRTQRTCPNCRVHVTDEERFQPLY